MFEQRLFTRYFLYPWLCLHVKVFLPSGMLVVWIILPIVLRRGCKLSFLMLHEMWDGTSICTCAVLLWKNWRTCEMWGSPLLHAVLRFLFLVCCTLFCVQQSGMVLIKFIKLKENFGNACKNKFPWEWLNEADVNKRNFSEWYQKIAKSGWCVCVLCRQKINFNFI